MKRAFCAIRNSVREIVDFINDLGIKQEDIILIFKDPNLCTILYWSDVDED